MGELIERKKRILLNEPHPVNVSGDLVHFETDMSGIMEITGSGNIIATGKNMIDDSKRYQQAAGYSLYIGSTGTGYDTYLKAGVYRFTAQFLNGAHYEMYYRKSDEQAVRLWSASSSTTEAIFTLTQSGYYRFNMTSAVKENVGGCSLNYASDAGYEPYVGETASSGKRKLLKGINNVWSDSGNVTVKYWSHKNIDIIPPEYQRYNYLRTISHNANFDSGVCGDDTTLKIEFDWMCSIGTSSTWGSYYGPFGQKSVSGKQRWAMFRNTHSSDPNCTFWLTYAGTGTNATIKPFGDGVTCADKKMHCVFEYGTATLNGVSGSTSSTNPLNDEHIYFGTTSPTSSGISYNYGYFWYIKMWSHGKLIRNYVPVVRKSDNKAGFYDTVNHTFNPSIGSVDFVAGND